MLLTCLDLCRTLPNNTKLFARVATDLQMQGVSTDIPPESFASAPVDAMVIQFVIEGFLRGWGLSGSNVSLGHGTALFSTRLDVDQWNEACLQQIEHMNTDDLEGVDIVASKLSTATNVKTLPARVRRAGPQLRAVEKLSLRTSPLHRMRLLFCLATSMWMRVGQMEHESVYYHPEVGHLRIEHFACGRTVLGQLCIPVCAEKPDGTHR